MKNLFRILFGLIVLNLLFQCTKSTTQSNQITYQNQVYSLSTGLLENYGNIRGTGINLDLSLISSGLVVHETNGLIDSITGTGSGVNFEMFTNSATALAVGDYTFDPDSTGKAGTFDFGNAILNFNTKSGQGINVNIGGGVVSVKTGAPNYVITFNCTTTNGLGITGYFSGPLKYYDNTKKSASALRSGKSKHSWWKSSFQ